VRSVARKVLRAPRVAQGAARSARGSKASARRRRAVLPAASRRVVAVWLRGCEVASGSAKVLRAKRGAQSVVCVVCYALCGAMGARAGSECEAAVGRGVRCIAARERCGCVSARVMSRRRVMLRIGRRAKRTAHNVRRAWCAAHRAGRSARGPEASARRRRAEGPAASRRAGVSWCACVWVGAACEAWGAPVAHCTVRSARELEASAGRRRAWGLTAPRPAGRSGSRKRTRGDGGPGAHCAAARRVLWLCVRASDEQTARDVAVRSAREADGAQRVACVVCCAPCGAVGCVCVWSDAICVGGEGRRVERRLSFEPSRMRRPAERARAAGASVAATSGE